MIEKNVNGVKFLSFESLDKLNIVTNAFSTRIGGVSKGYFSSMNLGFLNGDIYEDVYENYRIFSNAIGVKIDHMVRTKQTHTTNVKIATLDDINDNGVLPEINYTDIDGLVTNVPGIALTTFYADCVPLYFVDPINKAIGLSHSGWRGSVKRMGQATIQKMCEVYGSKPENIHCAIGPSICKDCYEVSEDVAAEFINNFGGKAKLVVFDGKKPGKYQLDLWEANKQILIDAGILRTNIECAKLCTCCNSELLFSHRASQGKRGNLAAVLMLNS